MLHDWLLFIIGGLYAGILTDIIYSKGEET
jgi:hypothetical protein